MSSSLYPNGEHVEQEVPCTDHDLLVRIDERTLALDRRLTVHDGVHERLSTDIYGSGGLHERVGKLEGTAKTNRSMIVALWSAVGATALTLFGLLLDHLFSPMRG